LRGVRSVREGARRIGVRPGFSALECIIRFGREADSEVSYMVGVGRQSTCSSGPRPGSIGRTAGCSRLVARKVSATEPVHCDSRLVASAVLVRVGVGVVSAMRGSWRVQCWLGLAGFRWWSRLGPFTPLHARHLYASLYRNRISQAQTGVGRNWLWANWNREHRWA
jgi:hypothetical protein